MCHLGSCDTDTKHDLHVPWYSRECAAETDTEEKKLLNKAVMFAQKVLL